MFLVLNKSGLMVDKSTYAQYALKQKNGTIIGCQQQEAEAIYCADSDTFYPITQIENVWSSEKYTLISVETIPDICIPGYYYYDAGEFYTTEAKQAILYQNMSANMAVAELSLTAQRQDRAIAELSIMIASGGAPNV